MRLTAALLATAWAGCEPTFDRVPTLVDRTAILAVQAEPAEAAPGDIVALRAARQVPPRTACQARGPPRSVAPNTADASAGSAGW